jgi:hypothetical protein
MSTMSTQALTKKLRGILKVTADKIKCHNLRIIANKIIKTTDKN